MCLLLIRVSFSKENCVRYYVELKYAMYVHALQLIDLNCINNLASECKAKVACCIREPCFPSIFNGIIGSQE